MEYESFGRSGLMTSRICFGGMLLSKTGHGPWRMPAVADEETSSAMLDRFVKAGGNFIDTSNNYGESEIVIGNWLKKQSLHTRRKLIISTKFTSPINTIPATAAINYPNSSGSSRKHIMDAIEDSLEKLQTNYIDIYCIHYWDDSTQLKEIIRTLHNLIQMGRIRYYGICNYTPVQLHRLISVCKTHQWELPIFIQTQYNLLCRAAEWELIDLCKHHGIGFLAWSPLAGGWLSNKYSEQNSQQLKTPPPNSRMAFAESVHFSSWDFSTMANNPKTWKLLKICNEIATEMKSTVSRVAIRWILNQQVTGCIVGPRTLNHIEDNIAALKLKLTPKHISMLNEITHSPPIYPYCAFSELTVKSIPSVIHDNSHSSITLHPSLQVLIDLSSTFKPTPNRSAWQGRLINQQVYELASNVNPHYLSITSSTSSSSSSSLLENQTGRFVFIFGGFLSYEEPITTLQQYLFQPEKDRNIQLFIDDALELINNLYFNVKKQYPMTYLHNDINLMEWIRIDCSTSHSFDRPCFAVCLSLILINQFVLLMNFLQLSNINLEELKKRCIFSSGFSLGLITAYVVDRSQNTDQLRHNALAAIQLAFSFGFRANQAFDKWKINEYNQELNRLNTNLFIEKNKLKNTNELNYKTGSLQISGISYQLVCQSIEQFNKTNEFNCKFDICVVTQSDRITICGFVNYLPILVEYLENQFPNCLLVSVSLDVPTHAQRYFQGTTDLILNDFCNGKYKFQGNAIKNQWNKKNFILNSEKISDKEISLTDLINNILMKVCRWDLTSDYLSEIIQFNLLETSNSSNSIVILDFGPSARSTNLINNNKQLKQQLTNGQIELFIMDSTPSSVITASQRINQIITTEDNNNNNNNNIINNSIAIIGMACRFPDSDTVDEFYYNLLNKKHSIKKITTKPWDHSKYYDKQAKTAHKTNVQHMGMMDEIDLFDPQFFNLNVRDANHMDPIHRLTLEMSYLALENAGYVIREGSRIGFNELKVGVFVGCTGTDNYRKNMEAHLDAYLGQCAARSMQAGRVSYFFKFCGPSIQLDAACASSLVCLHLAFESIQRGECDVAVVSAALISTDPVDFLGLAAGGFFSTGPNGGCKAFSADADGYTRSDGVAAIIIKPYRAALRDRDYIHALINSTAVNQSGQSQNLLLPSQPQIETLIHTVLTKAHLSPSSIQFIEAHGTGTQGGDPIEMNAIMKVLGMNIYRTEDNPLYIGAHKAFIGHAESAAGLAGLIKTVMMLQHKTITPHIKLDKINPKINLQQHTIICQESISWKVPHRNIPRRAIVNSFGFSGANASCILQETPILKQNNQNELIVSTHLITISGKHPDSVKAYTLRFIQYLIAFQTKLDNSTDLSSESIQLTELRFLRDLSYTTTARRNHFLHRIAIVVSSIKELIRQLIIIVTSIPEQLERLKNQFQSLNQIQDLFTPLHQNLFLSEELQQSDNKTTTNTLPTRIVFLFGGQGSQYFGMCRQLLTYENTWSYTFNLCSQLFSLLHPNFLPNNLTLKQIIQLTNENHINEDLFNSTEVCQPLLFSIEYSLGRMLMSWGICPDYIIGHSLGELVGACLSSVLSLEDALFLIGHRARLMSRTPNGSMLAINSNQQDFINICQNLNLNQIDVSIAAYNDSKSIVVAGKTDIIDKLHKYISNRNLFSSTKLNVTHAFHTHFMEPILQEFQSYAKKILYKTSEIPIIDTLNGQIRTYFNSDYWTQQLSQPVQFHSAILTLCSIATKENVQPICIELNATSILKRYLTQSANQIETYSIMQKTKNDFEQIYSVIAQLYTRQIININWNEMHRTNSHARNIPLPNYAFNYKSCWLKLPWIDEISIDQTKSSSNSSIHNIPFIGQSTILNDELNSTIQCSFPVYDRVWRVDIENHIVATKPILSFPLYTSLTSQFALFALEYNGKKVHSDNYAIVKDVMIKSAFIWNENDSKQETSREMIISLKYLNKTMSNQFSFTVSSLQRINNQIDTSTKATIHATGIVYFSQSESSLNNSDINQKSFKRILNILDNHSQDKDNYLSYDGNEFYRLSSQLGTIYGSHYQSIEKFVVSKDALTSWSKQIMKKNQPYVDKNNLTLIHTSWLDSFVQGVTIQVSLVPNLNRPFVAMFVENLISQTYVYNTNISNTNIFYTENTIQINNFNRITCQTRGFDKDGKCIIYLSGGIMISTNIGFNNRYQSQDDLSNENQTKTMKSNQQDKNRIEKILLDLIANSLEIDSNSLDINENFANMGIDSLLSIEIRGKLQQILNNDDLPPTILFDYSTINELTQFLRTIPSSSIQQTNEEKDSSLLSKTENNNINCKLSSNEIRNSLANLMGESLEIDMNNINDDDQFANIGIDSLLSIEIRGKIETLLNLDLSPSLLFDYPTLKELVQFLETQLPRDNNDDDEIKQNNKNANFLSISNSIDINNNNIFDETNILCQSMSLIDQSKIDILRMTNSIDDSINVNIEAKVHPKISTIKSIYSKISLPQIIPESHLLYSPFSMINLCQAYTLGQFLPEMSVRSHALFIKRFPLDFDVDKFEDAWNQCIIRHPMLRCEIDCSFQFQILKEVPYYKIQRYSTTNNIEQQEQVKKIKQSRLDLGINTKWPMIQLFVVYGPEQILLIFDADIAIIDFHSLLILSEELVHIYRNQSYKLNQISSLNYPDYIKHYKNLQENFPLAKQHSKYWTDRLSTLPDGIQFPKRYDRTMSHLPLRSPGFDSLTYCLDSSLWQKVQSSIKSRGLQASSTICALFACILSAFCNSNHFTINFVFVNRLPFHPDVDRLVGNLSSAFLLEFDYRDLNLTFYQRARQVYQQILSNLANSSFYTASHLVPILNNQRRSTFVPISSVAFVSLLQFDNHFFELDKNDFDFYFERNAPNTEYAVLETAAMELDHQIATTSDGSLSMAFDFVKDMLPDNILQQFIQCYIEKITSLTTDEGWETTSLLNNYNIHAQPLIGLNSIERNDNRSSLLFTKLIELATNFDDAHRIALICVKNNIYLSYQQIFYLALKLSIEIKKLIAKKDISNISSVHIGITSERGWEQIISCLAVTLIGAVFVPIDPDLPLEQYKLRLKFADISFICITEIVLNKFHNQIHNIEFINVNFLLKDYFENINDENNLINFEKDFKEINFNNDSNNVAYIIFTSGTTGEPKAVCISHKSVMNTILDINQRIHLNKQDRILALSNLSFDLSIYDIFGTFNHGSTLVLLDQGPDSASDPFNWIEIVDKYQITIWNSVPQLLYLFYSAIDQNKDNQKIKSLRQIILSGDWIPLELPYQFYSLWKTSQDNNSDLSLKILSLGGATECSIWSIYHWIDCTSSSTYQCNQWSSIPYGQPLNNQSIYILTPTLDQCSDGVIGQIYIGGMSLAKGYYNNKLINNKQFIIHPKTKQRLYATGDSGRFRSFNSFRLVELLGRIKDDSQVKIQGYRIETSEIETIIKKLNSIQQVVVIAKQTISKINTNALLLAFIVSENENKTEILNHCQNYLPNYMIPHHIIFLKQIPKTCHGKIDRNQLLSYEFNQLNINNNQINNKEDCSFHFNFHSQQIIEIVKKFWSIWNQALNRSDQRILQLTEYSNANIFNYGATSLTLLILRSLIQQEFNIILPLRFFIEQPQFNQMINKIQFELNNPMKILNNNRLANIICLHKADRPILGPLIFFHPSTGSIHCYKEISELIIEKSAPRHSYAIQAFGLENNENIENDLKNIIQIYFDTIKSIHIFNKDSSTSMITFIGYSSGGILAYQIAQEFFLNHFNNFIQSIILIDTPGPLTPHTLLPVTDELVNTIVEKSYSITNNHNGSFSSQFITNVPIFQQITTVTKANLVAIQSFFDSIQYPQVNSIEFKELIQKIIMIRANDQSTNMDDDDQWWGWDLFFQNLLKNNPNHSDSHSQTISLKKPIWISATHFQLLSQPHLNRLIEKLTNV